MSSTWLRSAVQWILVVCCAEAVTVPVAAFACVLSSSAALQIQDERETETVAVASESRRRVETPAQHLAPRPLHVVYHGLPSSEKASANIDARAELKSRFLSLRC
jgi:hypothetical protein